MEGHGDGEHAVMGVQDMTYRGGGYGVEERDGW